MQVRVGHRHALRQHVAVGAIPGALVVVAEEVVELAVTQPSARQGMVFDLVVMHGQPA